MIHRKFVRGLLVALSALLLPAAAQAQLFRAYLSASGSDSNPCTLISPCRLLPAALTAVASGGEIWMLDSANYNTANVIVNKSVSILAVPGAVGSLVSTAGSVESGAISITAAGLTVALRNLVLVPLSGAAGFNGVYMTGASSLVIENSLIANFAASAVFIVGTGKVKIANTIIRNSFGAAVALTNGATGEISGTQMLANFAGVSVGSNIVMPTTASVSDSVISGGSYGVEAGANVAGAVAKVFVTRSTIEGAAVAALFSQTTGASSAVLAVSSSMITNNAAAWSQTGAGSIIRSLGNNHITDNTGASAGVLTPTALQ